MFIAARRLRYLITNPRIVHQRHQLRTDTRLSFYPVIGLKQTKTGIMVLNKPDNNNNVTLECADQIFRFLSSFHHDHTVENVWVDNKGSSFSGGADYQQLLFNQDYLDRLLRLAVMVGEFNKPIFAKVHGSARGLGAYLVSMFSTPLATEKSSLKLDQTARGFIPIFGGSHRLSRLPCNIGIYLALTGDKLDSQEMARIGFLKGKVRDEHSNSEIHKHLSNANLWHRHVFAPSSLSMSYVRKENVILYKRQYFKQLLKETQKQIFKSGEDVNSNMALNQYRLAQTDYYNMVNPSNSFTIDNQKVNNYFEMRHDRAFNYLKGKGIVQEGQTDYHVIARLPVPKLLKVFGRDSVQGVLEELKKDGSDWAKRTEEMIRSNDPLAVHLTFHLIKKAQNFSWVECLEEEYKIARRILKISQINHSVSKSGKTLKGLKSEYSKLSLQQIKQDTIEQFFSPAKEDSEMFDHDTPNHSFLPTSDYWRDFSDASRNYLNRTFFEDYYSKFAEMEVKRFLHANKIDYRDSSYSISTLRKYLYKKVWYDRMIDLERQRIRGIFKADAFFRTQNEARDKYLKEVTESAEFPKIIEKKIQQYFEKKFKTRFDGLNKTVKIAGKESRMEIIRNYVNTLTENIVFNGRKIEEVNRQHNIKFDGIIRFDEKGSDAFHAENDYEKNIPELETLKKAYKNNRNLDDLQDINSEKIKPDSVFSERELLEEEQITLEKEEALRINYNKSILAREQAFKYRTLIERAGKTSEEIAGLMGWENTDIESMLINAPKTDQTFLEFAEESLKRAPSIEAKIKKMNDSYEQYMKYRNEDFQKHLNSNQEKAVKHIFFDDAIIPKQFRAVHLGLYEEVVNFYSQKYSIDGAISNLPADQPKQKQSLLKIWNKQSLNQNFSKLMKSDIDYTFSYLVILHLKDMLTFLQQNKTQSITDTLILLNSKFGVDLGKLTENQFNGLFMQYLYQILDLHENSKQRIIFPQTKLIEFLNCFKIQNADRRGLKFESLMLLIAKDRKMIRDSVNGEIPLLGYTPELTLAILNKQQKQNNTAMPLFKPLHNLSKKEELSQTLHMLDKLGNVEAFTTQKPKQSLILSFPHYLRRFQGILQQISGSTIFLPKQLYKYEGKQTYELAKDLLKITQNQQQWLNQKLDIAVESIMDYRFQIQKNMSVCQLKAFDQEFGELFKPEVVRLVVRFQGQTEEYVARQIVSYQKNLPGPNEAIDSLYLDIKSEIKNPRALRLLNNLVMTYNMVRDRSASASQLQYRSKSRIMPTRQQSQHLDQKKKLPQNNRTLQRLAYSSLRYNDDEAGATPKNIKLAKTALGKKDSDSRTDIDFLDELADIHDLLNDGELKVELEDRIKRMRVIEE